MAIGKNYLSNKFLSQLATLNFEKFPLTLVNIYQQKDILGQHITFGHYIIINSNGKYLRWKLIFYFLLQFK